MKLKRSLLIVLCMACLLSGCSVPLAGYAEYRQDPDNWDSLETYNKIVKGEDTSSEDVENTDGNNGNQETAPSHDDELPSMKIHFLDVGQGNAVLFETEDTSVLIDGGDRDTSSYVVSYLQNTASLSYLDALVCSHYDSDHASGLIGALTAYRGNVGVVFDADYESDTKTYESYIKARDKSEAEHILPAVDDVYKVGEHIYLHFLGPSEYTDLDNDNSLIVKVIYGNTSFLLPADAELKSLEDVSNLYGKELSSDVLVLSHHGSYTGGYQPFLSYVAPDAAVLQCGKGNEYGHPHDVQMNFLQNNNIPLYRNDLQREIIAYSDGNEITWSVSPSEDYRTGDEIGE